MSNRSKSDSVFDSLKKYWSSDLLSGFLVSLIALPLCLGIASASGFPPMMGVLTAIVGGLVVSLISGSELTIKGPAAGLIVIVAGAVEELGKGDAELGWKLALGVVVCAAIIQILMGLLKVAKLADFFPVTAVHGMLAAIGIIIISKQIHFALGVPPDHLKGKGPIDLIGMMPESFVHFTPGIAIVGLISLAILFGMPLIKNNIVKKIPPALVVLVVGVILGKVLHLDAETYAVDKPFVNAGTFSLSLNADFSGISGETMAIFFKYVLMFALIGSLESLLTVKASDLLDPMQRKSDLSKDLTAIGIGNVVSGLFGGLPMISEVARSSANINNGGKSRWANFFHGVFLLLFVLLLLPVIKMVPVASLSAMLIYVGFRLASPKEFVHTYRIGAGQLVIFVITIIVTLTTDLLLGIGAGILVKMISHLMKGVPVKELFRSAMIIEEADGTVKVVVSSACLFTNWLGMQKHLEKIPKGRHIVMDVSEASLLDHSFMKSILRFKKEYQQKGGQFDLIGLENFKAYSKEETATRKRLTPARS